MLVSADSTMRYYAIQIFTGQEDDFSKLLLPRAPEHRLYIPKRALDIRRRGKLKRVISPVFPGYAFIESENIQKDVDFYWAIKRTPGFIRFLGDKRLPLPLSDKDLGLLQHFMSFGEIADTSKVTFDENQRIVVLEGPLKGLEGLIEKVDKRKGRAKVRLELYKTSVPIDLGFKAIEVIANGGGVRHEVGRT